MKRVRRYFKRVKSIARMHFALAAAFLAIIIAFSLLLVPFFWKTDKRPALMWFIAIVLSVQLVSFILSWFSEKRMNSIISLADDELGALRRDRENLIKFNASIISIAENLHPSKVLQSVSSELVRLHDADLCLILQFQEITRSFVPVSQYSFKYTSYDIDSLNVFLKILGICDTGYTKPRILKKGVNDENDRYMINAFRNEYPWILLVPMIYHGKAHGVLIIHTDSPAPTDLLRIELTRIIAHQAAVALIHAQLFQKAQDEVRARANTEEELYQVAFHDSLTGLPNRSFFMDRLNRAFGRGRREKDFLYAVVYFDCDNFKFINDSLGHQAGDEVLCTVTERILCEMRPNDTLARLGGDEFVLLFEGLRQLEDIHHVIKRMQKMVQVPMKILGREIVVSISLGVAISSDYYQHPQDLLRDSDIAMYRAKMREKGSFEFFDRRMRDTVVRNMEIESMLRQALDEDGLSVACHPIVNLYNGYIEGFEALVRWNTRDGAISPDEFIPMAEKCGLVAKIDRFVLCRGLEQLRQWKEAGIADESVFLSVNLSGCHFTKRADSFDWIFEELDRFCINPVQLHLEITETAVILDLDEAYERVRQLKDYGIKVKVDDFGTGYSSLTHLAKLNADSIKIDKSFIMGLEDEQNQVIVRSIISLSKDLGLDCVAEGIEKAEHVEFLKKYGCRYGQGYYFSRPLSFDGMGLLLKSGENAIYRVSGER